MPELKMSQGEQCSEPVPYFGPSDRVPLNCDDLATCECSVIGTLTGKEACSLLGVPLP